jgi:hypothetical protein
MKIVMLIVSLFTPDLRYYANVFGGNNGALIHFVQSTLEAALAGDQPSCGMGHKQH